MRKLLVVFLIVVAALIYNAVHVDESEDPRPGYVDTGQTLTSDECLDRGGEIVGDVCYTP
jgi:hypothetical protein